MRALPLSRDAGELVLSTRNRNVIVAGLGTKGMHSVSWFDVADDVTFDLIGTYYGSEEDAPGFACAECVVLYRHRGTKWMLLRALVRSRDWKAIVDAYEAFMLADDDLIMSAGVIARAFALFDAYGLQLAQPSVCAHAGGAASHETLYTRPGTRLRYTAFVEVQMPIATRETLVGVIQPTLRDAHTGWGLDYVWPFLLGYPRDGIAVIDDVCALHPAAQPGKQSTYALKHPAGLEPWDEYLATIAAWGLNASSMARRGLDVPGVLDSKNVVWGSVPATAPLPAGAHCDVRTGLGLPGGPRCALLDPAGAARGLDGRLGGVEGAATGAQDKTAGNALATPGEKRDEAPSDGQGDGDAAAATDGRTTAEGKKTRDKKKKTTKKKKRNGGGTGGRKSAAGAASAASAASAAGAASDDKEPQSQGDASSSSSASSSSNGTAGAASSSLALPSSSSSSSSSVSLLERIPSVAVRGGAIDAIALAAGVALGAALAARYAARRAARPGPQGPGAGPGGPGGSPRAGKTHRGPGGLAALLGAVLPTRAVAAIVGNGKAARAGRDGRSRLSASSSAGTIHSGTSTPEPTASRSSVNGGA